MITSKMTLLAVGAVVMVAATLVPTSAAAADRCVAYCNQKHPGIQAWLRPGCVALCKTGAFFTKVGKGIAKGFSAVAGGIVKVFIDIKNLIVCVAKRGAMDIIKLFGEVIKDPGGFFKKTFTDAWKFLQSLVQNLVTKGGETLSSIVGAATGGKLDVKQFHAFGDWVWDQFEVLAKKVGALGCLVTFARPLKKVLRVAFGWLAKTVLPLLGKLYRNVLEPKLAGWLASAVDWAVKTILGEKWKDRIKAVAAKVFSPDARAGEAAKGIGIFIKMIDSGKGNLNQAWLNVRAMIASAPDFGVRQIALAVREGIKLLVDVLIDKLGPKVVDLGLKAVSGGLTLITRVVNGLCGLIPEVGAAICAVITGAVRLLYDFVGSALLKTLIMKGVDLLLKPLVNKVIDMIAAQITKAVTGVVDKAVAKNKVVGNWARVFEPLINLVSTTLTKWAVPDAKDKSKFLILVAQLGDHAVKLASARRVGAQPAVWPALHPVVQPVVGRPIVKRPIVKRPIVKRPIVKRPIVKRPIVKRPIVKRPIVKRPVLKPVAKRLDARQVARGLLQLYRRVVGSRVQGLRSIRPLTGFVARSKMKVPGRRALSNFRRGLQSAVRLVYAMRRRMGREISNLAPAVAAKVSIALGQSVPPPEVAAVKGPAGKGFGQAKAALTTLMEAGARYVGGLTAAATGKTAVWVTTMAKRFQKEIQRAASGLGELAKSLR